MDFSDALELVTERFPFDRYICAENGSYVDVADTVSRLLPVGAKILDFGCGPCDKTAILQYMGFQCTGYDDLSDSWHVASDNRERIQSFARNCGIEFVLASNSPMPFNQPQFDMVMAHGVLEHLHDSPRDLLNDLVELLNPGGLLFVSVPNAVNLRKRLDVLRGRTNLPPYEYFYWHPGPWRGHIREYAKDDLVQLSSYLGLETVALEGCDHMLNKVPGKLRSTWRAATSLFPGLKDSWKLVARKPINWQSRKCLDSTEVGRVFASNKVHRHAA